MSKEKKNVRARAKKRRAKIVQLTCKPSTKGRTSTAHSYPEMKLFLKDHYVPKPEDIVSMEIYQTDTVLFEMKHGVRIAKVMVIKKGEFDLDKRRKKKVWKSERS